MATLQWPTPSIYHRTPSRDTSHHLEALCSQVAREPLRHESACCLRFVYVFCSTTNSPLRRRSNRRVIFHAHTSTRALASRTHLSSVCSDMRRAPAHTGLAHAKPPAPPPAHNRPPVSAPGHPPGWTNADAQAVVRRASNTPCLFDMDDTSRNTGDSHAARNELNVSPLRVRLRVGLLP